MNEAQFQQTKDIVKDIAVAASGNLTSTGFTIYTFIEKATPIIQFGCVLLSAIGAIITIWYFCEKAINARQERNIRNEFMKTK